MPALALPGEAIEPRSLFLERDPSAFIDLSYRFFLQNYKNGVGEDWKNTLYMALCCHRDHIGSALSVKKHQLMHLTGRAPLDQSDDFCCELIKEFKFYDACRLACCMNAYSEDGNGNALLEQMFYDHGLKADSNEASRQEICLQALISCISSWRFSFFSTKNNENHSIIFHPLRSGKTILRDLAKTANNVLDKNMCIPALACAYAIYGEVDKANEILEWLIDDQDSVYGLSDVLDRIKPQIPRLEVSTSNTDPYRFIIYDPLPERLNMLWVKVSVIDAALQKMARIAKSGVERSLHQQAHVICTSRYGPQFGRL